MATTFFVPGEPVPQPRPRVSTRGGFARAYVPKSHPVHAYREAIALAARAAGVTNTGKPMCVHVTAEFARPKSHMNKRGVKDDAPILPRPDVDNLGKACLDGLQDVIGDDTLVRTLIVSKQYADQSRTIVSIT